MIRKGDPNLIRCSGTVSHFFCFSDIWYLMIGSSSVANSASSFILITTFWNVLFLKRSAVIFCNRSWTLSSFRETGKWNNFMTSNVVPVDRSFTPVRKIHDGQLSHAIVGQPQKAISLKGKPKERKNEMRVKTHHCWPHWTAICCLMVLASIFAIFFGCEDWFLKSTASFEKPSKQKKKTNWIFKSGNKTEDMNSSTTSVVRLSCQIDWILRKSPLNNSTLFPGLSVLVLNGNQVRRTWWDTVCAGNNQQAQAINEWILRAKMVTCCSFGPITSGRHDSGCAYWSNICW